MNCEYELSGKLTLRTNVRLHWPTVDNSTERWRVSQLWGKGKKGKKMDHQRPLQDNQNKLRSQCNLFLKAHDDTLRRKSLWGMELVSKLIIDLLQLFISFKGLGHMPLYGQPKSSCEVLNVHYKSFYLDLTQLINKGQCTPISKGQRWEILHLEALYFLNRL